MENNVSIRTSNADVTALISLKARALSLQSSGETLTEREAALVPGALRAAARSLTPASSESLTVEIRKLAEFARAFNVPALDLKTAAETYREALQSLPSDLLSEAFRLVKSSHKFGMRLPLPSEILVQVSEKLSERHALLSKLEIAQRCPVDRPSPETTEADRKRVTDIIIQWRTSRAG